MLLEEIAERENSDDYAAAFIRRLEDQPEIRPTFEAWLADWRVWARIELENEPVRILYSTLFQVSEKAAAAPEELEIVVGVGCLTWRPENHDEVRRHVLVLPIAIHFDDTTGRITVSQSEAAEGPGLELDMLDAGRWPPPHRTHELSQEANELAAHLLSPDRAPLLLQRLAHNLDPDGRYSDVSVPGDFGGSPVVTHSPALILRRRSNQSLLRIFNDIREQLAAAEDAPQGILQLVDVVDHRPDGTGEADFGDPIYLPLPANRQQLQIVERVNKRPHTVVQGPPGTGKTHTIANLLSHLLAQGKRVLVTAQTDRALRELRAKLPDPLEALCVSVVGRDRTDLADLKVAVNQLAARAEEFDPEAEWERIDSLLGDLDRLQRERANVQSKLVDSREREVITRQCGSYSGTLAEIAKAHLVLADSHSWLSASLLRADEPPIKDAEALEWLQLLRHEALEKQRPASEHQLPGLEDVPAPERFAELVEAERRAEEMLASHGDATNHPAYESLAKLDARTREAVRGRVHDLADEASKLAARDEAWMSRALTDVYSGRPETWKNRHDEMQKLLASAKPLIDQLGVTPRIEVTTNNIDALIPVAEALRAHLAGGGKLRGIITPRPVKEAQALLTGVRVNGLQPNTVQLLDAFIGWIRAIRELEDIERLWPKDVPIPEEDTLSERWAWNRAEVNQLGRVMALAQRLHAEEQELASLGIPKPNWADLAGVRAFGDLVETAAASESRLRRRGRWRFSFDSSRKRRGGPTLPRWSFAFETRRPTGRPWSFGRHFCSSRSFTTHGG